MKSAAVVIGSGFGDEGKGLITDYLAHPYGGDCMIVRYNGSCQAGHTVQDGTLRHVFHHFGSGTLMGAATFLSRFFVSNPILFLQELRELRKNGIYPTVWVDPWSPVTTPYEMMLNQIMENVRGGARHGSCGIGFGETIERNLNPKFRLCVGDLFKPDFPEKLARIRFSYIPLRIGILQHHGLNVETEFWKHAEFFKNRSIMDRFIEECEEFKSIIRLSHPSLLQDEPNIIFEGAQGLLLDQDHRYFPHVTRSNTGLKNVLTLAREWGVEELVVNYVSRTYLTRHGAGPLSNETAGPIYEGIRDDTNIPDQFQGNLRFAPLDVDALLFAIQSDRRLRQSGDPNISIWLALTCLDQMPAEGKIYYDGYEMTVSLGELIDILAQRINISMTSWGPRREDVTTVCRNSDAVDGRS